MNELEKIPERKRLSQYDRKLSHRIRGYVDDPESTGRLYYGEWGALRPDQRRMIRQLCDECDAFEKAADQLVEHYETIIREKDAEIERLKAELSNNSAKTLKRFEKKIKDVNFTIGQTWEIQCALKDVLKEMAGDF